MLRKIYFDNARRLLARSLPLPVLKATRAARDFVPDGRLDEPAWQQAAPIHLEYQSNDATSRADISTTVRALWTEEEFLYLGYECPYQKLTAFSPTQKDERIGLWDKDVVEAFIGTHQGSPTRYTEYEWAPNNEKLDLSIDGQKKDFAWSSGMESAVSVDAAARVWRVEVRIPLGVFFPPDEPPPGTLAPIDYLPNATARGSSLYRHDTATRGFLAFSPTLADTFHTPTRFGWLEFVEAPAENAKRAKD